MARSWMARCRPLLLAVAIAGSARPMFAQHVGLHGTMVKASHELLGAPLYGLGIHATAPTGNGSLLIRVGLDRGWGRNDRTGVPCAGLVEPGTCAPERVHDDARMTMATGGLETEVVTRGAFLVDVSADLVAATISVTTRGQASSRLLSASKGMWGGMAGARATWLPRMLQPIGFDASLTAGVIVPVTAEQLADGYAPFENAMRIARLTLGLSWRR